MKKSMQPLINKLSDLSNWFVVHAIPTLYDIINNNNKYIFTSKHIIDNYNNFNLKKWK